MKGMRGPHGKLATHGKHGAPHVSRRVPETMRVGKRTIHPRARLRIHERVEYRLMKEGASYRQAHAKALIAERGSMTKQQWHTYNGKLSGIARKI